MAGLGLQGRRSRGSRLATRQHPVLRGSRFAARKSDLHGYRGESHA
jgi:hypothetical protein